MGLGRWKKYCSYYWLDHWLQGYLLRPHLMKDSQEFLTLLTPEPWTSSVQLTQKPTAQDLNGSILHKKKIKLSRELLAFTTQAFVKSLERAHWRLPWDWGPGCADYGDGYERWYSEERWSVQNSGCVFLSWETGCFRLRRTPHLSST